MGVTGFASDAFDGGKGGCCGSSVIDEVAKGISNSFLLSSFDVFSIYFAPAQVSFLSAGKTDNFYEGLIVLELLSYPSQWYHKHPHIYLVFSIPQLHS